VVFVTVGTPTQGFSRLLQAVDRLTGRGLFAGETVFMQIGSTSDFVPRHCDWAVFVPRSEFERRVVDAGLVICHGGTTVLEMVRVGKVPVVMPRRRKYGEHINDHQVELVELLASEGRVVPAWEPTDLPGAIVDARGRIARPVTKSEIGSLVEAAIRELSGECRKGGWQKVRRRPGHGSQ
jgi:UDP-N-acetylglucosamine transferase subunit ALG13